MVIVFALMLAHQLDDMKLISNFSPPMSPNENNDESISEGGDSDMVPAYAEMGGGGNRNARRAAKKKGKKAGGGGGMGFGAR